jgi:peroxiredoxin
VKENVQLELARELLDDAIECDLSGRSRLYTGHWLRSGFRFMRSLSPAYVARARLAMLEGRPGSALADLSAARELLGQISNPELSRAEGELWASVHQLDRAEAAFARAWREGHDDAIDDLREIYVRAHADDSGFDDHVAQLLELPGSNETIPAPHFAVTDLAGRGYDFHNLHGKVVVLKFWTTLCAPCIVEMPGLNTLVDEFAHRDVVFLGMSVQDAETLERFLEDHEFKYSVIPEAGTVARDYGAHAVPTHFVIGRDGMIQSVLVGGSTTRHEDLRRIIRRALAQSP